MQSTARFGMPTRIMAGALALAMLATGTLQTAYAGAAERAALASQPAAAAEHESAAIQRAEDARLVRDRLDDMGYSREDIQLRLDRLSDAELRELAQQVDEVEKGGVHGVLVAVVLVLLILVLLDKL